MFYPLIVKHKLADKRRITKVPCVNGLQQINNRNDVFSLELYFFYQDSDMFTYRKNFKTRGLKCCSLPTLGGGSSILSITKTCPCNIQRLFEL